MKEEHFCGWMIERRSDHYPDGIQCRRPANFVQMVQGHKRHLFDAHMSDLAAIKSAE